MDERAEEIRELDEEERHYRQEQEMDALMAMLTPASEYRLPMADHE